MSGIATPALVGIFLAGAVATWVAGVFLSKTTDALDDRLHLGEALGGMILLSFAGSLPELAITVTAAASGHLGLATGNLVGGIAVQTMVLVICDAVADRDTPLSYLVGSLVPVLEGVLVVAVCSAMLLGALLPASTALGSVIFDKIVPSGTDIVSWLAVLSGLGAIAVLRHAPDGIAAAITALRKASRSWA